MKRVLLFTALLFLLTICLPVKHSVAQLSITPGLTAHQMVDILVGGGISNVSNVSYIGASQASGSFTTGAVSTNLGMSRGVLLTTGSAVKARGPNTSTGISTHNNLPGDPVFQSIFPGITTYDASILSFEFTPVTDTLRVRYVFGSDEYPEYANSAYNDVMGIFLSGPNPHGGKYTHFNMATIPGTSLPVSINHLNNGVANMGPCVNCQYYINNTGGVFLEYDGFTTVMTAWAVVIPDSSYSIRISIADAGDGIIDSGVFLEEYSFHSGSPNYSIRYTNTAGGNFAWEGCSEAIVTFSIPSQATDTVWIRFDTIMGTATNGVDFPAIPDSVYILPGHQTCSFTISPYADTIIEGIEYISLVLPISQTVRDTITVFINDYFPVVLQNKGDTIIACGDTVQIWVQPTAGVPPYHYTWAYDTTIICLTTSNPVVFPTASTAYHVTVTDVLGCSSFSDSVMVLIQLISSQPQDQYVSIGNEAVFEVSTIESSATYQWQTYTGSGFTNLIDSGQYSGVQTDRLIVSGVNAKNNNQKFRCVVSHSICLEYSEQAVLYILTGVEAQSQQPVISIYPNPAKSFITVKTTTELSEATWFLSDVTGRSVLNGAIAGKETLIDISGLSPGLYLLTLKDKRVGARVVQKVIVSD